jgi:hypothetical protein
MPVPATPKVYHITHVDNLPSILSDGALLSDALMKGRAASPATIGMTGIKERRFTLPVDCHPGTMVAEYVPFYFCPRSVMLYVISCRNHPNLTYTKGQEPIVHLEADLKDVVEWADEDGRRWAFSLSNAGAYYAQFRASLDELGEVDWEAVAATMWSAPQIKESKQAEFLVFERLPWELVSRIGVRSDAVAAQVATAIRRSAHRPPVVVLPDWYY